MCKLFERHVYYMVNVDSQIGVAATPEPEGPVLASIEVERRGMESYLKLMAGLREAA